MMSTASLVVVVLVHLLSSNVVRGLTDSSLPYGLLYPFGADVGDRVMTAGDENTVGPLDLGAQVPFGEETYSKVYIHNNGLIPLNSAMVTTFLVNDLYTPRSLPITDDSRFVMLAPFWADVDTFENVGRVYYRIVDETSSDAYLLNTVSADIRQAFRDHSTFTARILFIVTWHNVTFYGGSYFSSVNTFQAVLASDLVSTFVIYNYGQLRWSCGRQSGGNTSGLGGIGAVVGYNTGSAELYAMAEGSLSDRILRLANSSNVGIPGRWSWLVVKRRQPSNSNTELWPSFDNPILSGPVVQQRLWFEFYCDVVTNETDSSSVRFEVQFLFDNQTMSDVPTFTVTPDDKRATLHEKYLNGKLGKSLSCLVKSYNVSTPSVVSTPLYSTQDPYYLGMKASTYAFDLYENDLEPKLVVLKSTLPVTCPSAEVVALSDDCRISLTITSTDDIAVRQRYPGIKPLTISCLYVIKESDWKSDERLAYNDDAPLEVIPKVDPTVKNCRINQILFTMPALSSKNVTGLVYENPWSSYEMSPRIITRHCDSDDALLTCSSTGDPHMDTFDGIHFSVYGEATFTYARSMSGLPLEVQVRHKACNFKSGRKVSCVCGIALREGDDVIGIDRCNYDDPLNVHLLKFNGTLPSSSGIFMDASRRAFKLQMPSGTRIYGNLVEFDVPLLYMHLVVVGHRPLEGLCGTPNSNKSDDLKMADSDQYFTEDDLVPDNFFGPQMPIELAQSWSVERGKTLFDGVRSDLPHGDDEAESVLTYCQCDTKGKVCGGPAVSVATFPGEPDIPISESVPEFILNRGNSGKRRRRRKKSVNSNVASEWLLDDIDTLYNPTVFPVDDFSLLNATVSTENLEQATDVCWRQITDSNYIGPCIEYMNNSTTVAQNIVNKCVKDILLTDSFDWVKDKIGEMQKVCQMTAVRYSYEHLAAVTNHVCTPYDCSGHGQCVNAKCVCHHDYIGADCAVSRYVQPSVDQVIDPSVCDINVRPCLAVNVKTTNAASVDTLSCKITATYMDGRIKSFIQPANLTTPSSARCSLPTEPLLYFNQTLNLSSVHDEGFDFDCVYRGSPVVVYTISMSNDGRLFGSQTQDIRIVDQSCMQCSGSTCRQRRNSCLINGYCFNNGDLHPYLPNCYQCRSSGTTSTQWTSISGSQGRASCTPVTRCTATGTQCIPTQDHSYYCVATTTTSTTTPSTSTSTSTTSTTSTSTSTTSTTSTSTSTTSTPSTSTSTTSTTSTSSTSTSTTTATSTTTSTADCGCQFDAYPDMHSFYGSLYRGAMSATDCRRVCSMNVDCVAVDYNSLSTTEQCWLYFGSSYTHRGPSTGITQYPVRQPCERCNSAKWQVTSNVYSKNGVKQSNIASLADCLQVCIGDVRCVAVDYDDSGQCFVHGSLATVLYQDGTYQYAIIGSRCIGCPGSTSTSSSVTPMVSTRATPKVTMMLRSSTVLTCQPQWDIHVDENSFFGIQQSDVFDLDSCLRRCLVDVKICLAFDYTANAGRPSERCWLHIDPNFYQTRGYFPGTTQYVLVVRCPSR